MTKGEKGTISEQDLLNGEDLFKENPRKGRLLSNRFADAPREASSIARWLDAWVSDPESAIGRIFDLGNEYEQTAEARSIQDIVFGKDPVIDSIDFERACMNWLNAGPHERYQYEILFNVLEDNTNILLPEVLHWYLDNVAELKRIFSTESPYNRFIEKLEFLASGKTIAEYHYWWRNTVRAARSKHESNND